jgi:hypothetical protein
MRKRLCHVMGVANLVEHLGKADTKRIVLELSWNHM